MSQPSLRIVHGAPIAPCRWACSLPRSCPCSPSPSHTSLGLGDPPAAQLGPAPHLPGLPAPCRLAPCPKPVPPLAVHLPLHAFPRDPFPVSSAGTDRFLHCTAASGRCYLFSRMASPSRESGRLAPRRRGWRCQRGGDTAALGLDLAALPQRLCDRSHSFSRSRVEG